MVIIYRLLALYKPCLQIFFLPFTFQNVVKIGFQFFIQAGPLHSWLVASFLIGSEININGKLKKSPPLSIGKIIQINIPWLPLINTEMTKNIQIYLNFWVGKDLIFLASSDWKPMIHIVYVNNMQMQAVRFRALVTLIVYPKFFFRCYHFKIYWRGIR